ncbi:MAG: hypothetical protein ACI4XW_05445 [Candidatus Spyradocola sp.]
MQMRTRTAVWLDRLLGAAALYGLSALWFTARLNGLLPGMLLAAVLTALLLYAGALLSRRVRGGRRAREQRAGERRAALYALTMLPYPDALEYAVQALTEAYPLTRLYTVQNLQYLTDTANHRIAAALYQIPQPADIEQVHTFHRERRDAHGVLLCVCGATDAAQSYAASLLPPLRLLDLRTLPLPNALLHSEPARYIKKQRGLAQALANVLSPTRALRYLTLGALLLLVYLLTDRLTALFPALVLVLLALLSKRRASPQETLF